MRTDDHFGNVDGMIKETREWAAGLRAKLRSAVTLRWVAITLGTRAVTLLLNFAAGVLLARSLGVTGRGEFAFLVLFPELANSLGSLGFHEAVTYHTARGSYSRSRIAGTAFVLAVGLGAVYAAVVLGLYGIGVLRQQVPVFSHMLLAVAAMPLQRALHYLLNILRGVRRFGVHSRVEILRVLVYLCSVVVLLQVVHLGLTGALLAYLASTMCALAVAWYYIRPELDGRLVFDRAFLLDGLRYGVQVWPGTVTGVLSRRVDFLILPLMAGTAALGQYAVATQLAEAVLILPAAMVTVLMPMTVNSGQEGMKRIDRYLALQLAVFVPGGLIIALIGPYALVLLFGEEYAPAYGPLLALMPGILALSCSSILSSYFSAQGRPLVNAMGAVLGLSVGIPAYLMAIPRWGPLGAGVASSVSYAAQLCYQWWWYARARAVFGALRSGSG